MGTSGSKKKIGKTVRRHHDASMLNSASRLAQSHISDTSDVYKHGGDQPVWEKRVQEVCFSYKDEVPINIDPTEETHTNLYESKVYVFKETVFDKGFNRRSLPPIPSIPSTDSPYSENCYDQINDILIDSTNMIYMYESPNGACSMDMSKQRAVPAAPIKIKEAPIQKREPHEADSLPTQTTSHEVSGCLGFEEMVEIFKPLIIKNLLVREILPHLPFIEDHEDLYVADRRSPSEAVVCLLRVLKSCKEVGKWHKFLEALQLCGYEYIVQNIKGYRFINHKYQTEYLKSLTPKLSKMLKARELLPRLCAEDMISQNDREEIEKQDEIHGNIAAATMLLNRITRKLPDWYTRFITVLRDEGFSHIADDLDIPNLTRSEKVKVQKPSTKKTRELNQNHTTSLECRHDIIERALVWWERTPKPLPPLPSNIEQDVQTMDIGETYDDFNDTTILMDIGPPLPPRGVPKIYSFDDGDIYDINTYDNESSDQGRCNISPIPPVIATSFLNEECTEYEVRQFRLPSRTCPPRVPSGVRSPPASSKSKHKSEVPNEETCKQNRTQPINESHQDDFYGYETYDEYEPSTYRTLSEYGTEKGEENSGDKFHALKQEVYTLQDEGNDLDEEIKHLQDKNDLQGNVNEKLRRKRELLQSINIKEKEAAALKAPVSSPVTDDYYCPESARMFWGNSSSVYKSTAKTTIHFPNEFKTESTVISNTPVMIYDPKSLHGTHKAWSFNDSAIDCVY